MNSTRIAVCLFAAASVATCAATEAPKPPATRERFRLSDLLPRSLQRDPKLQISALTEFTPEGKALPAPDPARPAYYAAWDGGLVEGGDVIAGERPPRKEHLAAILRGALSASGYLPATADHPPTVVIHYRWGSYNHLTSLDGGDPVAGSDSVMSVPTDDLDDPMVRKNLLTRAALVGGVEFSHELLRAADRGVINYFRLRDPRNEDLVEMALGDLYFVVAVAYDAESARKGKARQLWMTKISTNSNGLAMDETLPTLAFNGRKLFGHETNGPVLAIARLLDGKVSIGELRVVTDEDTAKPAPKK